MGSMCSAPIQHYHHRKHIRKKHLVSPFYTKQVWTLTLPVEVSQLLQLLKTNNNPVQTLHTSVFSKLFYVPSQCFQDWGVGGSNPASFQVSLGKTLKSQCSRWGWQCLARQQPPTGVSACVFMGEWRSFEVTPQYRDGAGIANNQFSPLTNYRAGAMQQYQLMPINIQTNTPSPKTFINMLILFQKKKKKCNLQNHQFVNKLRTILNVLNTFNIK